jgi:hypothetical protein
MCCPYRHLGVDDMYWCDQDEHPCPDDEPCRIWEEEDFLRDPINLAVNNEED